MPLEHATLTDAVTATTTLAGALKAGAESPDFWTGIWGWLKVNWMLAATSVVTLASILANLTDNEHDNKAVRGAAKVVDFLAFNGKNAKNK